MTLEEYKESKRNMEQEIYEALRKFQDKTELLPENIHIETIDCQLPVRRILVKITTRVIL